MELTLVLTHNCNLRCTYCYAGEKIRDQMSPAMGRQALQWVFDHYQKTPRAKDDVLQVGYFGGEPMLQWPLVQDFHQCARELSDFTGVPLRGAMTTNGTLLTEAKMDWCVEHGVVVAISIDGAQATHDRLRPMQGGGSSHERVLKGLKIALSRNPIVETVSVVSPETVGDMATTVRFLLDEGVRVISLSMNYGADWDLEDLETYRQQMELVGDIYAERFRAAHDIYISSLDAKIIGQIKGGLDACDRCSAGINELALAPSGNWYPCERMVGDDGPAEAPWVLGNIHATGGGPDQRVASGFTSTHGQMDAVCAECPVNDRCMNTCACSNVMGTGEPQTPGGALCASEQIAIETADRVAGSLFQEANPTFIKKHYKVETSRAAFAHHRTGLVSVEV